MPPQLREAVVESLVQAVSAFGNRIGTGSVALAPLFRALHAAGRPWRNGMAALARRASSHGAR